jgi:hypothetical protein
MDAPKIFEEHECVTLKLHSFSTIEQALDNIKQKKTA